jgi:hypothetical protein
MWRVLRAELSYFRTYLLFAWSIAVGVAVLVNGLTLIGSDDHPGAVVSAGLPGIFFVISAMIVGFIAQGTRSEERRARLLLAGPVTPRQLGVVMVLLPAVLLGAGTLAGVLLVALAAVVTGKIEATPAYMVATVAGQMFAIALMGPLAQESAAALRQGRSRLAVAGWTGFVLAILLLVVFQAQLVESKIATIIAQVVIALIAMVVSAVLYAGRTDFTR